MNRCTVDRDISNGWVGPVVCVLLKSKAPNYPRTFSYLQSSWLQEICALVVFGSQTSLDLELAQLLGQASPSGEASTTQQLSCRHMVASGVCELIAGE
jgi:hypothetical protein